MDKGQERAAEPRVASPFAGCETTCRVSAKGAKCGRKGRMSCLIRATLKDHRGQKYEAIIHNVGERRIGVTFKGGRPVKGGAVWLVLSDGQVLPGHVTLVRDDYCDLELDAELDVDMFSDIARHRKEFLRDDAEWGITAGHRVIAPRLDAERTRRI